MISRLLQFSRRGLLTLTPVRPGAVVGDLSGILRRLLPESIRLEITDTTGPGQTVRADTGAVEQILVNLCTNARDAMPEGGTLRIECAPAWLDAGYHATHPWVIPGPYVCIAVTDSGTGMDEETQRRLFEPFFTTKPASQGTGLGMAMVYGLMKRHNGMVHVYSEVEQGTTVKLYFPVVAETAQATAPRRASDPHRLARGTETILLVEDDPAIRRTTRRALESRGYTVLLAEDGEEALERYQEHKDRIALVISDLVMPKLGGRQLAEALREAGSPVRILFTSGYSPGGHTHAATLPEGIQLLQKPWSLTDLFASVRTLLDR
jgi:two-component system cell cycle sensor histidine kinase/response regulator CckA